MDYGKAITFMFQDSNWIGSVLIGGGLILFAGLFFWTIIIPLLVAALIAGYMIALIRAVRLDPDAPLPEWSQWGDLLSDGIKLLVVQLIWGLPIFIFILGSIFFAIPFLLKPESDVFAALFGFSLIITIGFSFLYGLFYLFVQPAFTVNLAVGGTFSAGLDVRAVWHILRQHVVDILIILVLVFGLGYVAQSVGALFFLIGTAFTSFWMVLVKGHLYGQLARQALPPTSAIALVPDQPGPSEA